MKSAGIKPIIVVPPMFLASFNDIYQDAVHQIKQQFYSVLKELETETGKVEVFDFFEEFSTKREFFYEPTHLNLAGAREFTKLIQKIFNDQIELTI